MTRAAAIVIQAGQAEQAGQVARVCQVRGDSRTTSFLADRRKVANPPPQPTGARRLQNWDGTSCWASWQPLCCSVTRSNMIVAPARFAAAILAPVRDWKYRDDIHPNTAPGNWFGCRATDC